MSRQGYLNPFLRHFLLLFLGSLIVIFLFAIVGSVFAGFWLGTFSQALSASFFFAVGGAMFALGGHLVASAGGIGEKSESGMFALRSAGLEKADLSFEQDELKALTPSMGRILMSILFAALFLGLAMLASLLPESGTVIVLLIAALAIVVGLDWGLTSTRSL